ncbi:MAG: DEAD/DEAH box helicase family protein [Candidatus Thiodubiliella endoseptemdiera]|uniref:DEAD/DEAH box helicase family protein n=1 Tax=Candidatus Thiodubiliella endoseptemdiera TaxID=2738886 RepID=A0A853F8M1_9GAMM|nr:DEAD/DEAH box helicase family protein [Candidatus Thiodubiliella endoseptemdiera]
MTDYEEGCIKLPNTEIVKAQYSLFDHQVKASVETIKLLHTKDRSRAILHMPTGSGKTRTAMHIIANYLRENQNNCYLVGI